MMTKTIIGRRGGGGSSFRNGAGVSYPMTGLGQSTTSRPPLTRLLLPPPGAVGAVLEDDADVGQPLADPVGQLEVLRLPRLGPQVEHQLHHVVQRLADGRVG